MRRRLRHQHGTSWLRRIRVRKSAAGVHQYRLLARQGLQRVRFDKAVIGSQNRCTNSESPEEVSLASPSPKLLGVWLHDPPEAFTSTARAW